MSYDYTAFPGDGTNNNSTNSGSHASFGARMASTEGFSSSMRPMPRQLPSIFSKYPMHTVNSQTRVIDNKSGNENGLTYSVEDSAETPAAQAEYEVLRAILQREHYLQRLHQVVRTVGKKFKPEVGDVLDLVRQSTLEVIDMILKWRKMKNDPEASFIWNGLHYLLKMPSDLDYLADYLAIQKWMGFQLSRNPFCIPFPMETGAQVTNGEFVNPQSIEQGHSSTDGFTVGGTGPGIVRSQSAGVINPPTTNPSPYGVSNVKQSQSQKLEKMKGAKRKGNPDAQSFIFNEDMKRIRNAEAVILGAEARFGVLSRDPQGRLVPLLQALTRKAAVELKRDDHRPLVEPAQTNNVYAPHASRSDVGLAEAAWTPEIASSTQEENAKLASEKISKHLVIEDDTVKPWKRGEGKSGGALQAIDSQGSNSRPRKPIKSGISSTLDFSRNRSIRTLNERIAEINQLRAELESAKTKGKGITNGSKLEEGSDENLRKIEVLRSALSNQMVGVSKSISALEPLPDHTIGTTMKIDPKKVPSEFFSNIEEAIGEPDEKTGKKRPTSAKTLNMDELEKNAASSLIPKAASPIPGARKKMGMSRESSMKVTIAKDEKEVIEFQDPDNVSIGSATSKKSKSKSSLPSIPANDDQSQTSSKKAAAMSKKAQQTEEDAQIVKALAIEEAKSKRQLHYFQKDEDMIYSLKLQERSYRNSEGSRNVERKRRLLNDEEGRRQGPPSEDDANVYDYYAVRVQSLIRGWLVRCWVRWYRQVSLKACILIQSALRGWFGRMRVRRIRRQYRAAVLIQKNFRGWNARGTSAGMAKKQNLVKKSILIQRVWRGILGIRRTESKRALDKAAREAFDAVDARSLVASDVKELARRIIYAIEEPSTTSFPPDEVLHLIKLTIIVIQSARGLLGVADYDFFNARHYNEIDGFELTWTNAAKMVNRSERFIRLIRALAFGPGAKPPRLIQLSSNGSLLYAAQAKNPKWCVHTFETMGMGSRICVQVFKWLTSMIEIATRQQEFLSLIATSFPDWLPKLNDLQKSSRSSEFEIELHKKCLQLLQEHAEERADDPDYIDILDKEIKITKRTINDARVRFKDSMTEIDKLKNDQASREVAALQALEGKVESSNLELQDLAHAFQETVILANKGDRAAQEKLSEIRHLLTNQRLKTSELDAQRKMLELQIESNKVKRKDPARLPADIVFKTIIAGEAKAAYIISQVDTRAMLKSSGVKHASDLPMHLTEIHDELFAKEEELRHVARKLFVDAEKEKKILDDSISRAMNEGDLKEQKSKDQMIPTDEELEEERIENEKEAIYERMKHMQYLPDQVVYDIKTRPRPMVIAMSRDLPEASKQRMMEEILRQMPGTFVYMDCKERFGFDILTMQKILDANKCILMMVDHGLTRTTRDSFLNVLDLTLQALIPTPLIAIAVGNEKNHRGDMDLLTCGVASEDLQSFRDSKIKMCLEWMSWACLRLSYDYELRYQAISRAYDLIPSSKSLALVIEALFVLFSEGKDTKSLYRCPDHNLHSMIWQRSRLLLLELDTLIQKMKDVRRGQACIELVVCMQHYMKHPLWPSPHDETRGHDLLLNILASFVEYFVDCEILTMNGGGAPLQSFTKSSMRGIQTVVTVTDKDDELILPYNAKRPSAIDVQGDRDHVADLIQNSADYKISGADYRHAAALLIRASLQDLRIMKTVLKINREPHTISVYRENNTVFFEAYDNKTSDLYMSTLAAEDIPSVLVANGHDTEHASGLSRPPGNAVEMYERLVKLLKFDVKKEPGKYSAKVQKMVKTLVCKRDFVFLQQIVRRIDGYRVVLKCYEASMGELLFKAYMPEYSSYLETTLGINERLTLLQHADKGETKESEMIDSQDARPLLPYILDRLRIYPTKLMYLARKDDGRYDYLKTDGFQKKVKSYGFNLKVKAHGGAGKVAFRKLIRFMDILHVIEVRISSPTNLLEVKSYEPISRTTRTLRISHFLRKALLGSDSDDHVKWSQTLLKRLRKDWHGDHAIFIDRLIVRQVVSIEGERHLITIAAHDEEFMTVSIVEPMSSLQYSAQFNLQKVRDFLLAQSNLELAQKSSGKTTSNMSIISMLQEMKFELQPTKLPDAEGEVKPNAEEMLSLLQNSQVLFFFVSKITPYLTIVDKQQRLKGYKTQNCPLTIHFELDEMQPHKRPPLNTDLVTKRRVIVPRVHKGDLDSMLRIRRQTKIVFMETELNSLAIEKSKVADVKVIEDVEAAVVLGDHLKSFSDPDSLQEAIQEGSQSAAEFLLDSIHTQTVEKLRERLNPGYNQKLFEEHMAMEAQQLLDNPPVVEEENSEDKAIVSDDWKEVIELGVKANFREGKVRWHGHVSVKIFEDSCWVGDFGMGKRYKFLVYEPNSAMHYEGVIRSGKHLAEILGRNGRDLLAPNKAKEMLLFVCRYRLDVVVNKKTWDGADVEAGAPPYRIEFQSERTYTNDKVTPINVGGEEDEEANKKKMLDIDNARGKKIVRLVRRVSGLLMQLTVFELPTAVAEASLQANPMKGVTFIKEDDKIPEEFANQEEDDGEWQPKGKQPDHPYEADYAEKRKQTHVLRRFIPPAFRIVGYDPKSKRKVSLGVEPQAAVEVSGGVFSPYFDPEKRRELAKIICDALILNFPSGRPFELMVPWSGAKNFSTAEVEKDAKKISTRSGAERVVKRPGRLFRAAVRISKYELIVSMYQHSSEISGITQLIFNFYSPAVSEAAEITVDEDQQIDRIGAPILSFLEGSIRTAAIRRFCRFFGAEIIVDILDPTVKTLHVVLLPPNKDFVTEYQISGVSEPGENIRPVGYPGIFFPLDTCGKPLHRRGMTLENRDKKSETPTKEFLVTVYTKSELENPERGLVIKFYDRGTSLTSILHVGPSELIRLCDLVDEPDLLRDIVTAQEEEVGWKVDDIEAGFKEFTEKGQLEKKTQTLHNILIDIILKDLGFFISPQETVVPYFKTAPRGIFPE